MQVQGTNPAEMGIRGKWREWWVFGPGRTQTESRDWWAVAGSPKMPSGEAALCDSHWQQLAWGLLGALGGKIKIIYSLSAFSCSLKGFQDWTYAICRFSLGEQPRGILPIFSLGHWTYPLLTSLVFGSHMKSWSFQPCVAELCNLSCKNLMLTNCPVHIHGGRIPDVYFFQQF